ncbi:MAG TPA: Ig-like domain-containing protein [Gemmatimonadales bacterium]|nr:Ig-like domain-containing protein [Gemmatimonadales bacterium]
MLKNYRKILMAGIVTLGLAACGDDLTITDPVQPPPTSNITSFSVSPTSATIAPGTFLQASANLVTIAGVTGSVSWGSSNSAVATVDPANGRIDAVSEGTAVITATATAGGQTATAAIGVTVRPIQPAQISIQSVTTGMTNTPVNISNVMGQIEINMNFNPGEQLVDSVAVFIGNKRAAKQSFATSPSAGPISLSVNTANYVKNVAAGTATVDYQNGASTISAAVYPRSGAATATNTIQIVLNNTDGWAGDLSKPTQTANSAAGLTYWGGPGAAGLTTVTLYPVIYTPGRTVASAFISTAGCGSSQFTSLPFRGTFGYAAAGADFACNTENLGGQRDNVIAYNAIDNTNNVYPTGPLIANTVVLGSTPDSLRFDWKAPVVNTPSITRTAPAVTGWVNASWNFINFSSADGGVGIRASASRDRAVTYTAPNCGGGAAVAMPTGTGADIPECATNFIGGTPGLGSPGTAPYRVTGTESDRLANVGTSSATQTFGVDKTLPSIRWGLNTGVYAAQVVVAADSQFRVAKPAPADEYRVEYLDDRAGFYNMGAPLAGVSAQAHALSTANHVNNAGACLVGTGPIGATFVTAPACAKVAITTGGTLRVDGWQGGMSVANTNFVAEGYYGYSSNVTDAAGNTSGSLFRKAVVSTISPFATGLTIPGSISGTVMAFGPTFADSTEVVRQSLQLTYPEALTLPASTTDSLRYSRSAIGVVFDDAITSPYLSSIAPNTGAPYVRHLEAVTGAAFPNLNVQVAPVNTKPVNVVAWSWNPGSILTGGPAAGRSLIVAIPALLVQDGVTFNTFNYGADGVLGGGDDNVTNSVQHFRIIASVATTNQFGSTAPLRAQAVSPTNTPNQPFARVDFYRQVTVGPDSWWSYLGSSTTAIGSDQGTYRSWVYNAPGTFVNAWNGTTAQTGVAAADVIMAVGVTAAGDGLATSQTMTP